MVLEHIGMPQPETAGWYSPPAPRSWKRPFSRAGRREPAAGRRGPADRRREPGHPDRFHFISRACGKRASGSRDRSGFELLAVNRAEGFRAGAEFYCLPPLKLERYTGFTQPSSPGPSGR